MKILTIRDIKIGFGDLFIMPNEGSAIRDFGEACKNEKSNIYKFPEDYELWSMGDFNQSTGIIELTEPKCIAKATQYKIKEL